MLKKVPIAGLLACVVLMIWTFVSNAVFGFKSRMDLNQVPDERQVYEVVKKSIVTPGRYICNPALTSSGMFPPHQPVFSIHYSGVGHESAQWESLLRLPVFLLTSMIAAWMLAGTSAQILSSYPRKVLFFSAIGLLFALYSDLLKFGIDGYPMRDALILAAYDLVTWTLIGLVVAWKMKPEPVA